ncbi:MAG: transglycosylase SLT domain-containing protein [Gemmatimonadota bacterium]
MTRRHLVLFACLLAVPVLIRLAGMAMDAPPGAPAHRVEAAARADSGLPLPADLPDEVHAFLERGQNWRAARAMREYLGRRDPPAPSAVLLAARAEAGWGGWDNVRVLLEGEPWLDRLAGGEGWYLLGRALEEDRAWEPAAAAYARFLRSAGADSTGDRGVVAGLRQGLVLTRLGRVDEGTAALEHVRRHDPAMSGWAATLMAEALEERGDTARIRALLEAGEQGSPARTRRAYVRAHLAAGDPRGARAAALRFRERSGETSTRASFLVLAARAALETRDSAAARGHLLSVVRGAPGSGSAPEAARLLRAVGGLTADDRLALARVDDRHGANLRAAEGYGAWLAPGRGGIEQRRELRLLQGRAYFDAGRYAEAEAALRRLSDAPPAVAAPAGYLLGRAQYRRGNPREARATLLDVARRFPRTPSAAEALFLVADLAHDAGETAQARALYRRVAAESPGGGRAGLALMRLGGMAFEARDWNGALAAWEEARRTLPSGSYAVQATYWSGRALAARGDSAGAAARWREVRARDPLSYYALRSAERLDEPYWPIPLAPAPEDEPEVRARVEGWMHTLDLLRAAGLYGEAEAEADRLVERAGDEAAVLYPLAERLIERGYTVHGTRMGTRMQREAGRWNPRLLRIVYPFPYRAMITAEARERGLDPFLVAALIRQESTFKARISSGVGAMGLMQVMPETGRRLAEASDIRRWDPEILYNPEINVHLGVRYLADQMRRYRGSLPSVFSAYNAGPTRVERWKSFPEYRDEELFTERIPYEETRDYVKILTRNIAIYRGLYGE